MHGRELLAKAARQEQVAINDKQLEKVLEPLRQKSVEDLLAAVSDGAIAPRAVLEAAHPELKRVEPRKGDLDLPLTPPRRPTAPDPPCDRRPARRPGAGHRLPLCRLLPARAGRRDRRADPHRAGR